ncbi:MAG TPA: DUF6527 family protein [Devosiaceae bacterium]|nr:DUF6527 family protein [Devosiaceae bacterium]
MSEVKTKPVPARHFPSYERFDDELVAGSIFVAPVAEGQPQEFWYCCPCGCGITAPLRVGRGFKPAAGPSWNWNGSLEAPTLYPSVHHQGHWHGWLRNGVWESC